MNIVIPMAGRGARFADRGYEIPKPLIQVAGYPMIYWALKSLKQIPSSKLIFIALRTHEEVFGIKKILQRFVSAPFELLLLDDITEGQLCTVLTARQWIDADEGLLIANADTFVVSDLGCEISSLSSEVHGLISVADMPGERWSFARTDESGWVVEVAEKVRISDHASTGLYYFSSGREFLDIADTIIADQERTRGEYYVIPVYQKYIQRGLQVRLSQAQEMWDMGTPESLAFFQNYLRSTMDKLF